MQLDPFDERRREIVELKICGEAGEPARKLRAIAAIGGLSHDAVSVGSFLLRAAIVDATPDRCSGKPGRVLQEIDRADSRQADAGCLIY
jgi:hypothetical protein